MFFEAVSSSDVMMLSAFRFEEIGPFIQDQGIAFEAVAAVGAIYANQNNVNLRLSPDQQSALNKFCSTFRQYIKTRIQKPNALQDPALLLCIPLLAILEVCQSLTSYGLC